VWRVKLWERGLGRGGAWCEKMGMGKIGEKNELRGRGNGEGLGAGEESE